MSTIHDDIFDSALNHIKTNGVEAELRDADGTALIDSITLDSNNYSSPSDNEGAAGGRKITCLMEDGGDMTDIAVGTAGSGDHVAIKDGSGNVLVQADLLGAPVALSVSEVVSLDSFDVILKDPT
jgi:hypothetical protein